LMHIVYALKSLKNGKRYVGYTSKDVSMRLDWHRWGLTSWTKQNGPFELIHIESFTKKEEALSRERYFKTGQGRKTLDSLVRESGSSAPAKRRGGRATCSGAG